MTRNTNLLSEDRLQVLVPRRLKESLRAAARNAGLSIGEYVRRLIEADLRGTRRTGGTIHFPFGEQPIRSGRTTGSVDHDRPE
jgi:hypothetical protein